MAYGWENILNHEVPTDAEWKEFQRENRNRARRHQTLMRRQRAEASKSIADSELHPSLKRFLTGLGIETFEALVSDLRDRPSKVYAVIVGAGWRLSRASNKRATRIAVACAKRGYRVSHGLSVYDMPGMMRTPPKPIVDIDILEPWCIAIPRDPAQVREYERWTAKYARR